MYNKGISKEGDILDLAVKSEIVNKSGAWYSYNTERIGQGRENAKDFLNKNPKVLNELHKKVLDFYLKEESAKETKK